MKTKILSLLFVLALLGGCAPQEDPQPQSQSQPMQESEEAAPQATQYKKITAQQAIEMMGDGVVILDVRTPDEYAAGHIEGAVLLPDYDIGEKAPEVLPDKDATILVYCRTGNRSAGAAKELIELGYTAVYDFGGLETDWEGEVVT